MKQLATRWLAALTLIGAFAWSSAAPDTAHAQAKPLKNVPVVGSVGTGVFDGRLSITELVLGEDGLEASGRVTGFLGRQRINQQFFNIPIAIVSGSDAIVQPLALSPDEPLVCDILFLDLGPLNLDLLGLVLDLDEVVLDLDAVSGQGALLGNLLCAVTGLLDVVDLGVLLGGILEAVLDAINDIL